VGHGENKNMKNYGGRDMKVSRKSPPQRDQRSEFIHPPQLRGMIKNKRRESESERGGTQEFHGDQKRG